jgi:cystathionine beta-lyase/cystathionine gamma-synthase
MHKQALDILLGNMNGANPTRTALENALASIENGARGLAFHLG